MMHRIPLAAAALALLLACGCSTIVTALLLKDLLDDKAPKKVWTGRVTNSSGEAAEGMTVEVLGEVQGDAEIAKFTDETDSNGDYSISFRWAKDVEYTIRVLNGATVLVEQEKGKLSEADQETDFTIQSAISTELSGVVRGPDGEPLQGVLVVGASVGELGAEPVVMLDDEGDVLFEITSDSGVYQLEGPVSRYGIVCVYHPDHGFAYAFDEDSNSDGSIPLDAQMGGFGNFDVSVQVTDIEGSALANQILSPDRQFRVRLAAPFNLSVTIDSVVATEGLFPGLVGDPSVIHPNAETITVQSTGADGLAENAASVNGGNYQISLLQIHSDDPATALVEGSSTLVLFEDTTVVVRVN